MSLAANELQKAIYTRLTAQLSGISIFDYVPQSSDYPYVVIGDIQSAPADTKTYDAQEFTVTLHAFTKAAGKKSVQTIAQNAYTALHHQESNLTMTGFTAVLCRCEFSEAFQDPPPEGDVDRYFHAVQRYRVIVQTN